MSCSHKSSVIFDQIIGVMEQLSKEEYGSKLSILDNSTLGKHFRHIYDFYLCISLAADNDVLDYALRKRDLALEQDTEVAIRSYAELRAAIHLLDDSHQVTVISDFHDVDESRTEIQSSIGRELMYAYDHAIHHLAIIKIALKVNFPNIFIGENLGVAPSTIRYTSQNPALSH